MRNLIVLVFVFLFTISGQSQTKVLEGLGKFKLKNYGALMDANNDVNGYYMFYEVDKLKGGKIEYAIKFLDNNLNEVATKSYLDSKHVILVDAKFNGAQIMFAFLDKESLNYKFVGFDRKGEQSKTITKSITKDDLKYTLLQQKSGKEVVLYPIKNKGFILNSFKKPAKMGYDVTYIPSDGTKGWTYATDKTTDMHKTINVAGVGEKAIVFYEYGQKSLFSKEGEMSVVTLNNETGKEILRNNKETTNTNDLVSNAKFYDDSMILMGEYFKPEDNALKGKSLGLYVEKYDYNGERTYRKEVSWEDKLFLEFNKLNNEGGRPYLYFHDIIKTEDGSYYAIAEQYTKNASGMAIASMAMGGSPTSVTQLVITDAYIFKFDSDFNIQDVKRYDKGQSKVPNVSDFGSPQLNAHVMKQIGGFDYQYTQLDKKNDRFYALFIDYERIKSAKDKMALKAIMYNKGVMSEDKIYLTEGKTEFVVRPAKIGHVLLLEYNRKKKTVSMHIEKLNIQ